MELPVSLAEINLLQNGFLKIDNKREMIEICIIAHRGLSGRFPENTMIAFREALKISVDMIELDVQLSKDRKVVVFHDEKLGRTAPGKKLIKECSLKALKQLDAGSWFDKKFSAERIPTLEEVLELVGHKTKLNIEIKSTAYEEHETPDCIERQVTELIQKKNMVDSVVISSFETNCLRRIKQIPNAPPIALLDNGIEKKIDLIKEIQPVSYHPYYRRLSLEDIDQIHQANVLIYPFTVNNREDMKTMIDMGVDGLITNVPDVLKRLCLDHKFDQLHSTLW